MSLTSFKIAKSLNLEGQSSVPANPISGDVYYDKTLNAFQFYQNGAWYSGFASSQAPFLQNFVSNPNAEQGTTGWSTYSNTAANTPSTGTGGTATGLTFASSTSSPLDGNASFTMVQTNSTNIQGKGVSFDFTIPTAYEAKPISIAFSFNASSTFVAANGITAPLNDGTTTTNAGNSDVEVFLYDKTNSILIPVSPQVITANGANNFQFKGTFQTASNSTSYRLIFHVATANANATGWTFKFDDVYVGPQSLVQGAPITDWTTYTPTLTNFTSSGTNAVNSALWRRVGDSMEIVAGINLGSTGTVTGPMQVSIPSGYTIDTTKISTLIQEKVLGSAQALIGGYFTGNVFYGTTTSVQMVGTNAGGNYWDATDPGTWGSNKPLSLTFKVPIAGWSSTVQMSNDTDTRVVAAIINGSPATASANQPIIFPTIKNDTHGTYNATTGQYTAPVSGFYQVNTFVNSSASANSTIAIYLAGSSYAIIGQIASDSEGNGSGIVFATAGQTIDIRLNVSTGSNNASYLSINRLSGPATIAATDSINGRYFSSTTTISASLATVVYATKGWDSHGAYNNTTGIWTCPSSGKYQFNGAIATAGTVALNSALDFQIQQLGSSSQISEDLVDGAAGLTNLSTAVSDMFYCLAGDTIKIQVSSGATTPTIVASNNRNYISWSRVGN